jgi:hypothetical protein
MLSTRSLYIITYLIVIDSGGESEVKREKVGSMLLLAVNLRNNKEATFIHFGTIGFHNANEGRQLDNTLFLPSSANISSIMCYQLQWLSLNSISSSACSFGEKFEPEQARNSSPCSTIAAFTFAPWNYFDFVSEIFPSMDFL